VNREDVRRWVEIAAGRIHDQRDWLTELDKEIGDGDHGINMDRGFQKVLQQLEGSDAADIATVLKITAMALISSVGGASGPLYGTFFLRAAGACAGMDDLDTAEVAAFLRAGLGGVQQRGRAEPGDKTMVDALAPAVEALETAAARGVLLRDAMAAAVEAAAGGVAATVPMVARRGRASYLGDRSAGHQDPGATSSHLVLDALLAAVG
jgi:dihydroxyacetone kinase-like protein